MNKDILIVDDETEICLLLSSILQKHGFSTGYAHDLKNAMLQIEDGQFKLVFIDLNLPDGIGYDLFPLLKQKGYIKTIVISAYDNEKENALKLGADHFISKPFDSNSVLTIVKQMNLARS